MPKRAKFAQGPHIMQPCLQPEQTFSSAYLDPFDSFPDRNYVRRRSDQPTVRVVILEVHTVTDPKENMEDFAGAKHGQ